MAGARLPRALGLLSEPEGPPRAGAEPARVRRSDAARAGTAPDRGQLGVRVPPLRLVNHRGPRRRRSPPRWSGRPGAHTSR